MDQLLSKPIKYTMNFWVWAINYRKQKSLEELALSFLYANMLINLS